jgi:predicted nucleic acid-binding protein
MENRTLLDASHRAAIFVDTNILVYHLLDDELYGAPCKNFLNRVEEKELKAFISPIVIAESLFIYLRFWIIKHKKIVPKKVLEYLKQHREVINKVNFQKPQSLFTIFENLPIDSGIIESSYHIMKLHNLLPNDAINIALIKHHNISAIATHDNDFNDIEGIEVLKPIRL